MGAEPAQREGISEPTDRRQLKGPRARSDVGVALSRIESEIQRLENLQSVNRPQLSARITEMRERLVSLAERAYANLSGWQTVQLARHTARPVLADYLSLMVKDFCELHGDRHIGDDRALVTGFGRIGGHRVMLLGHNKGKETHEKTACRFGYPHPEGYRKALRAMKLAEKFGLPVVSLIDTPGAFPGVGAEERGIACAIATNLMEMARLRIPIVCVVVGEGGSGGALGIGVGDRVAMLRHAYFSVITPEGCASILFRDAEQKERAADSLSLRAADLKRFSLIDEVIDEPLGGAHHDAKQTAAFVESYLGNTLCELMSIPIPDLLKRRQARLRRLGNYFTSMRATEETSE